MDSKNDRYGRMLDMIGRVSQSRLLSSEGLSGRGLNR